MATPNIRILVGDDEEPIRFLIRRAAKPYAIDEAHTAEQLVERAREAVDTGNLYSLIISDNNYRSGIDGIEAIRRIRTFDRTTPIFWHSGDVNEAHGEDDKNLKSARESGATYAMLKDHQNFGAILRKYKSLWDAQSKSAV
jgi:CheY-like chemotaxis protein